MTKFKCGTDTNGEARFCTSEELDVVENIRGGKLKTIDASAKEVGGVDLAGVTGSLKALIEGLPAAIGGAVDKVVGGRTPVLPDFDGFIAHEADCPECQEKHRGFIEENMASYAKLRGLKLVDAEPEPGDDKTVVGDAEKKGVAVVSAPAPAPGAEDAEHAEDAADAADAEDRSEIGSVLDRVVPVGD